MTVTRRASLVALLGLMAAGCGGGGSGTASPMARALQTREITSRSNGTTYPLYIYLPPNSDAIRATLPVVYGRQEQEDADKRQGLILAPLA